MYTINAFLFNLLALLLNLPFLLTLNITNRPNKKAYLNMKINLFKAYRKVK